MSLIFVCPNSFYFSFPPAPFPPVFRSYALVISFVYTGPLLHELLTVAFTGVSYTSDLDGISATTEGTDLHLEDFYFCRALYLDLADGRIRTDSELHRFDFQHHA